MCVCVCVCVCVHAYVHVYIYIYIYIHCTLCVDMKLIYILARVIERLRKMFFFLPIRELSIYHSVILLYIGH